MKNLIAFIICCSAAGTLDASQRVIVKYAPARRAAGQQGVPFVSATLAAGSSLERLRQEPGVEYAEVDHEVELAAEWGYAGSLKSAPSYRNQWGLEAIHAAEAWTAAGGDAGVIIAVIDTGVEADHPALRGRVIEGHDYIEGDEKPADRHGHGTHVAGILVGADAGAEGIMGVAPGARVLAIRVLDGVGKGYTSQVALAIYEAVRRGAKIINMSLQAPDSLTLREAVAHAVSHGCLVVVAAGNTGASSLACPASYQGVVAVAAVDAQDRLAPFSNHADSVVCAPGVKIYSAWLHGAYRSVSGTSMAAPHVSGLAALLFAASPSLSALRVRALLFAEADDLGGRGVDGVFGHGRVNGQRLLGSLRAPAPALAQVQVFPNPVRFEDAVRGTVKFSRLPAQATISVYTLTGERVLTLAPNGDASPFADQMEWDGRNAHGERVAMGTYLYVIEDGAGARKAGKLGVLPLP